MTPNRPTLLDVAHAAGVSRSTASYAFTRPERVSAEALTRVQAAAEQLGYAGPDPAAVSLRSGRANAIGVLFTDTLSYAFADPAAVRFLRGTAGAAERTDIALTLLPVHASSADSMSAVRHSAVDGVIAYALDEHHAALQVVQARRVPLVRVDMSPEPDQPWVGIDDRAAARLAADHLLDLDHRRIAVLADRLDATGAAGFITPRRRQQAVYPVARNRLRGYDDAFADRGLNPTQVPVFECAGNTREHGRRAARNVLSRRPAPTAVLAMSDQLAWGAIDTANDLRLRVPGDVSVVGFDNVPTSHTAQLTTIHQDHEEKGAEAARLLLEPGNQRHVPIVLPYQLVEGTTTARPHQN